MVQNEIALQLALKVIEHKNISMEDRSPAGVGLAISQLYNEIYKNLDLSAPSL